ncbi:uncharacterized protein LOC144619298 [Crassostrea virginica]
MRWIKFSHLIHMLFQLLNTGMATEVRDFSTQLRQEHVIPLQDAGLMVFPRSPSRVHCGALCSVQRAFCKTFFFDQVNEKCFLWDKTFDDSCGTNTTPSFGVQSYDFSSIGTCQQAGFAVSVSARMCFKYFYSSTPLPKETIQARCEQYGAKLLLLDTLERRNFFLQTDTVENGHVGLSDATEEGIWRWDNGCPIGGAVSINSIRDNEDDRYTCTEGADCMVVFKTSNHLEFKDYCCEFIKHWYCAIHF